MDKTNHTQTKPIVASKFNYFIRGTANGVAQLNYVLRIRIQWYAHPHIHTHTHPDHTLSNK